jgi:hypothetical protein
VTVMVLSWLNSALAGIPLAAVTAIYVVSRPFPSWNRSILTEIYLCHACSGQEILRTETAGQGVGLIMFLLPPVPGVPVYLTGGIILTAASEKS